MMVLSSDKISLFEFHSLETLKKQAKQQAAEFDRLATKYNEVTASNSDKRKD